MANETKQCYCGHPERKGWGHTPLACAGPVSSIENQPTEPSAREWYIANWCGPNADMEKEIEFTRNELIEIIASYATYKLHRVAAEVGEAKSKCMGSADYREGYCDAMNYVASTIERKAQ